MNATAWALYVAAWVIAALAGLFMTMIVVSMAGDAQQNARIVGARIYPITMAIEALCLIGGVAAMIWFKGSNRLIAPFLLLVVPFAAAIVLMTIYIG